MAAWLILKKYTLQDLTRFVNDLQINSEIHLIYKPKGR